MIKSTSERFYLSKRDKTIFIDNIVNIPQHYLDGIRFLYRSFNKKKPGIILNDQSNESRNTQIVLFLNAVQQLINKTILILCPEGREDAWLSLFYQWTDLNDDVIIESAKPYIRKKVLINPSQELPSFCSREWGVLVVDDDSNMLDVLRLPFKADFKIWSSPVKMTEYLHMFSHIYEWLYPKAMFNVKDFLSDKRSPRDFLDKAIFLEAFLRDVVLRRENLEEFKEEQPLPTLPKVTRKNKDATGTKIKRSKPKPVDVPTTTQVSTSDEVQAQNDSKIEPKLEINIGNDKKNEKEHDENPNSNKIDEDNDFKIINFKKKKDVIEESEVIKESDLNILQTDNSTQSDVKLYYECTETSDSDKVYEMNTLPLDNEVLKDESRNTNGNELENEAVAENNDKVSTESKEVMIYNKELIKTDTDQDSEENITHSKTDVMDENISLDKMISKNGGNSVNTLDEMQCDEAAMESNETSIMTAMMNELNNDQKQNDEVSAPATINLKRGIEDKIMEMEAKAMKKFKGSILDSLF